MFKKCYHTARNLHALRNETIPNHNKLQVAKLKRLRVVYYYKEMLYYKSSIYNSVDHGLPVFVRSCPHWPHNQEILLLRKWILFLSFNSSILTIFTLCPRGPSVFVTNQLRLLLLPCLFPCCQFEWRK